MNNDIYLQQNDQWFRLRACAIIIKDNQVLMAKNDKVSYYYAVGGAVKINESIEEAVKREVLEETGLNLEIDRLLYIHQNFIHFEGKKFHEVAFYFLMKKSDLSGLKSESYSFEGAKEEMVFIPIDEYHQYDAYPRFFREELKQLKQEVTLITTYED